MQYLIWDFDGTLGYRSGMWSGTLLEVLRQEMPECPATVDDMRPYLQDGFPWHRPEQPHTPYTTAEAGSNPRVPPVSPQDQTRYASPKARPPSPRQGERED